MNKEELEAYLLQSLNMALQINGETSYTNSFDIQVKDDGFFFIPGLPASYIVDNELYQKIYLISNAVLYNDTTDVLREEISSLFPYYVFSSFERKKHLLILEGTNFR